MRLNELVMVVKVELIKRTKIRPSPENQNIYNIGYIQSTRRPGFSKIAGPLTSILRTANSSENSLTSIDVAEVVGGGVSEETVKNLSKSSQRFIHNF